MADLAVETVKTVLPAQADDQLKPLIDDFLMDLEISRRSRHTIKNYRSDLGRFQKFIIEQGRPLDIVLIRSYLGTLQNVAPATRARHHSALKTFFEWCYRQDLIPANPMGKFRPPKVSPGLPRPIHRKALVHRGKKGYPYKKCVLIFGSLSKVPLHSSWRVPCPVTIKEQVPCP